MPYRIIGRRHKYLSVVIDSRCKIWDFSSFLCLDLSFFSRFTTIFNNERKGKFQSSYSYFKKNFPSIILFRKQITIQILLQGQWIMKWISQKWRMLELTGYIHRTKWVLLYDGPSPSQRPLSLSAMLREPFLGRKPFPSSGTHLLTVTTQFLPPHPHYHPSLLIFSIVLINICHITSF